MGVEGVETTSSRSTEGLARITLDFEPGWDMARATDDVQVAVDAVTTLPSESEDPVVRRGAWRDRVTDVVIVGVVALIMTALSTVYPALRASGVAPGEVLRYE